MIGLMDLGKKLHHWQARRDDSQKPGKSETNATGQSPSHSDCTHQSDQQSGPDPQRTSYLDTQPPILAYSLAINQVIPVSVAGRNFGFFWVIPIIKQKSKKYNLKISRIMLTLTETWPIAQTSAPLPVNSANNCP